MSSIGSLSKTTLVHSFGVSLVAVLNDYKVIQSAHRRSKKRPFTADTRRVAAVLSNTNY